MTLNIRVSLCVIDVCASGADMRTCLHTNVLSEALSILLQFVTYQECDVAIKNNC